MIKYVKLIAKPDTWFKAGTEVYNYDADYEDRKRITLEEYRRDWALSQTICVRGIRIVENPASEGPHLQTGQEIIDGEYCAIDEFDMEIIEE